MSSPIWCFAPKVPVAAPQRARPALAPPSASQDRFVAGPGSSSFTIPPTCDALCIRQVSDNIYCGPRPTAATIERLKALGVKSIINLEDYHTYWGWFGWRARALATEANIAMIRQPISPLFWVSQGRINAIVELLRDPTRGPFYVHCLFGKERTNLVVALHRRVNQSMSKQKVQRAMLEDGFRPHLVPLLASQVEGLLADTPKPAPTPGNRHRVKSLPSHPARPPAPVSAPHRDAHAAAV